MTRAISMHEGHPVEITDFISDQVIIKNKIEWD